MDELSWGEVWTFVIILTIDFKINMGRMHQIEAKRVKMNNNIRHFCISEWFIALKYQNIIIKPRWVLVSQNTFYQSIIHNIYIFFFWKPFYAKQNWIYKLYNHKSIDIINNNTQKSTYTFEVNILATYKNDPLSYSTITKYKVYFRSAWKYLN